MENFDFDYKEYLRGQAEEVASRRKKLRTRFNIPGEEVSVVVPPYTVRKRAAFEVRGRGNPDARLGGHRPDDPARALERKEETENKYK